MLPAGRRAFVAGLVATTVVLAQPSPAINNDNTAISFRTGAAATNATQPAATAAAVCTGSSAGLSSAQCAAWQAIYDGTGGAGWNRSCNTPGNRTDPCSCGGVWGVSCTVQCVGSDITLIDLGMNNLVGTIPAAIGALTALTGLSMPRNHLHGPIPAALGALKRLRGLGLIDNKLDGRVPPLPFDQYNEAAPDGKRACGIGGTGNAFCTPLPAGASACSHNGAVQTVGSCPGSPTPAPPAPTPPAPTPPPPAPTPADPGCLERVNFHRANAGLYAYTAAGSYYNKCADTQAPVDGKNYPASAHSMFQKCGESGQCEAAGVPTCAQAIDLYYAEGPSGGHYQIIMSTTFKTMAWGSCDNCVPKYGYMYTHDFYP